MIRFGSTAMATATAMGTGLRSADGAAPGQKHHQQGTTLKNKIAAFFSLICSVLLCYVMFYSDIFVSFTITSLFPNYSNFIFVCE